MLREEGDDGGRVARRPCAQKQHVAPAQRTLRAEGRERAAQLRHGQSRRKRQQDRQLGSRIRRAGHAGRHKTLLTSFVKVLRSVWGELIEQEPTDHFSYSDYQPDVAAAGYSRIGRSGKRLTADLKLLDDLSSNPEDVGLRGTRIAFGNTKPGIEAQVEKDYAFAAAQGCDVLLLLFSTFGGE